MKTFLLILVITISAMATAQAFTLFGSKKNMEFRFEDYSTAEEAKSALVKLHPIGSPVDELLKTLEKAGAKIKKENILNEQNRKIYYKAPLNAAGAVGYSYKEGKTFLTSYEWGGGILYNKDRNIIIIGVSKHYMGL